MEHSTKRKHSNHKGQRLQIVKNNIAQYALLLCLVVVQNVCTAQVLDANVSIKANNKPLSQVLFQLSEQAHFDFSYDNRVISSNQTITINAQHQPLRQVLGTICQQSNIQYKEMGSQIIFFGAGREEAQRVRHFISGQVTDYQTGNVLQDVTVTEKYFRLNTNTNAQGGYQLIVPNPNYTVELTYSLQGYQKKSYLIKVSDNKTLNVSLKSKENNTPIINTDTQKVEAITFHNALAKQMLTVADDSVEMKELAKPLIQKKSLELLVSKNVLDSLRNDSNLNVTPFQFSVIPGVGMYNQFVGRNQVNGFSFNLFAGLNAGVNGFELSSMLNIDRFNVHGAQVAGFANIVGGQVTGSQIAGFANVTKLKAYGWQVAGFSNFAGKEMKGAQIAGFTNFVRGRADGAQISGFYNIATDSGYGAQIAGFGNTIGGNYEGTQIGGLINITRGKIDGAQIAGFMNMAKEVNGIQIAGFLNYTTKLKGVQIGVFNFVDSVDGGVPIGVFNYVRNGYHRWEIQGSESGIVNLKYKSGTDRFYTYLGIGGARNSDSVPTLWDVNYGVGTIFRAQKPVFFNLEASAHWLNPGRWANEQNSLYRFDANIGFRLYKKVALVVGPSINFYVANEKFEKQTSLNKQPFFLNEKIAKTHIQGWFGLNAALQF